MSIENASGMQRVSADAAQSESLSADLAAALTSREFSRRDVLSSVGSLAALGVMDPFTRHIPNPHYESVPQSVTSIDPFDVATSDREADRTAESEPITNEAFVDAVAAKVGEYDAAYRPFVDGFGNAHESAVVELPLGDRIVRIGHARFHFDGDYTTEAGVIDFLSEDDPSDYVRISIRKDGHGCARKNNSYELPDPAYHFPRSERNSDEYYRAIINTNAYHYALELAGFNDYDLSTCMGVLTEADDVTSTFYDEAVAPMLRLDDLSKFNDYWDAELCDTEFTTTAHIDENNYFRVDGMHFVTEGEQVSLSDKIAEFNTWLQVLRSLSNGIEFLQQFGEDEEFPELEAYEDLESLPIFDETGSYDQTDDLPGLETGETEAAFEETGLQASEKKLPQV